MADYLRDLTTGGTITEDVIETNSDTPELVQVVSKALDGTVYIQNQGKINHKIVATVLLDAAQDLLLDSAWLNGHRIELSDEDRVYSGYIIGSKPSIKYVDTYHECQVTIQEDIL